MLRLPTTLGIQLRDSSDRPLPVAGILIGINFLVKNRYYYGNIVGLTAPDGAARITSAELEARFTADQACFPMDYKVDLADCDANVELTVMSARELADARNAIADNYSITPDIRSAYAEAGNDSWTPALARVCITATTQSDVVVGLVTIRTSAFAQH